MQHYCGIDLHSNNHVVVILLMLLMWELSENQCKHTYDFASFLYIHCLIYLP